ncbi:hypothetical protein M2459_003359 [Parabacteroides sp. PF5-5]|uniref:YbbR-like domain-containing protein n=1 Tax=unclassified Parabacteroides TaxID=2649774 RepID=UPI0024743746|nr:MULTISPECIES: YbbR-like domain-containing protein [unclassified Parabacteroides]MDH6306648.1 hypothetical protein [Parabacteroides sp. PH5-39]MDH6317615.1 hypothetical protein [Parabacteroides sp. PF5-13]MDH6321359.1 hypothetical protein [Parabacteroides sp. PH5-13]MDH6325076.1 hypothetical protein [Parabacteroides sp. PH5-8]MDH6328785.1 hypothetical protein [Parabacteroides sp. PH5-41]
MERLENIQQSFKSVYRKIKIFLRRYQWKEILIFLLFVILSFCFWVLQSMQEDYEVHVSIPVHYNNVPQDVAFVQTPPSEIVIRIRDKGSVLLNYKLTKKISSIEIDAKELSAKSGILLYPAKDIEAAITKHLIATTSLLSFNPQQIQAPYSKLQNKELPVVFNGSVRTEPGFQVSDDVMLEPARVKVYATEAVLDTLTSIKTVYTEIKKGLKTINKKVQLEKPNGVALNLESVSVTISIEEFTEKTLSIPVNSVHVPSLYTIRMFPAVVKVTCSVPLSRFKELTEEEFSVEISLADLEQNISGMLPVILTRKPDWVDRVSLAPDSIEFILEQNSSND